MPAQRQNIDLNELQKLWKSDRDAYRAMLDNHRSSISTDTDALVEETKKQTRVVLTNVAVSKRLEKKMAEGASHWAKQRKNEASAVLEEKGVKTFEQVLDEIKTAGDKTTADRKEKKAEQEGIRSKLLELVNSQRDGITKSLSAFGTMDERREQANSILGTIATDLAHVDQTVLKGFMTEFGDEVVNNMIKGNSILWKTGRFFDSMFKNIQVKMAKFLGPRLTGLITHGYEQLKDLFGGAVSEILGDIGEEIGKLWGGITKGFDFLFGDDPEKEAQDTREEGVGFLQKISESLSDSLSIQADAFDLQEKGWFKSLRDRTGKDDKPKTPWAIALFAAGTILGAVIGKLLIQFQLFLKMFGLFKPVVTGLKAVAGFFGGLAGKVTWLDDIGKVFASLGKIPMVGKYIVQTLDFVMDSLSWFVKGFSFGITKLAWPLQIIMSAFDFFSAFIASEESSFLGKLKDGIWGVVEGIIELPVMMIGWIIDTVLGWFGVEGAESANKIMAVFETIFGTLGIGGMLTMIQGAIDTLMPLFIAVKDIFVNSFGGFIDALGALFSGDIMGFFTILKDNLTESFAIIGDAFSDFFANLADIPEKLIGFIKDKLGVLGKAFGFGSDESPEDDKVEEQKVVTKQAKIDEKKARKQARKEKKERDTVGKLADSGVINKNIYGDSQLDFGKLGDLSSIQLQDIIEYDDWSEMDMARLVKLHADKKRDEVQAKEAARVKIQKKGGTNIPDTLKSSHTPAMAVSHDSVIQKTQAKGEVGDVVNTVQMTQAQVEAANRFETKRGFEGMASAHQESASTQKQAIGDLGKSMTESNTQIIQSSQKIQAPPDPPVDIEAMGILFVNKTWGLG